MGILTNIVAAGEDELDSIADSLRPVDQWSGIEKRGVDTAKIATLHSLLTGDEFDMAVSFYEPVAGGEAAIVLRLADEVMGKLAGYEEDALDAVAAELAATEEFELEGWDEGEVHELVQELADLARIADSQGQVMFVWMHPLLT